MNTKRTAKQNERQEHRTSNGKYGKTNPCYQCGKSAGIDYFSDHRTDTIGSGGEHFADLGLILCRACCTKSDAMNDANAFTFLSAGVNWPREEKKEPLRTLSADETVLCWISAF